MTVRLGMLGHSAAVLPQLGRSPLPSGLQQVSNSGSASYVLSITFHVRIIVTSRVMYMIMRWVSFGVSVRVRVMLQNGLISVSDRLGSGLCFRCIFRVRARIRVRVKYSARDRLRVRFLWSLG